MCKNEKTCGVNKSLDDPSRYLQSLADLGEPWLFHNSYVMHLINKYVFVTNWDFKVDSYTNNLAEVN